MWWKTINRLSATRSPTTLPACYLVIEKFPGANTRDVTRGVEEALDAMRPGLSGMELDPTIFQSVGFIESAINNIGLALLIGLVLVALVFAAFFFEWRAVLISLVAIPLSLMAAGVVLYLRGATINIMMIAGLVIALGVLIDDAINDIESIVRRLRQRRTTQESASISDGDHP